MQEFNHLKKQGRYELHDTATNISTQKIEHPEQDDHTLGDVLEFIKIQLKSLSNGSKWLNIPEDKRVTLSTRLRSAHKKIMQFMHACGDENIDPKLEDTNYLNDTSFKNAHTKIQYYIEGSDRTFAEEIRPICDEARDALHDCHAYCEFMKGHMGDTAQYVNRKRNEKGAVIVDKLASIWAGMKESRNSLLAQYNRENPEDTTTHAELDEKIPPPEKPDIESMIIGLNALKKYFDKKEKFIENATCLVSAFKHCVENLPPLSKKELSDIDPDLYDDYGGLDSYDEGPHRY